MNSIYVYDGDFFKGDAGFGLIKLAALMFCMDKKLPYDMRAADIKRGDKGKPYFDNVPLKFSLSHSEGLWMCMFSDKNCGLDLQYMKDCDYEKIAGKYFLPEEISYVKEHGIEGFYKIWVRKEAYAKMTGEGIFGISCPNVLSEGQGYSFTELEISDEMKCAFCMEEPLKEDVELKILK